MNRTNQSTIIKAEASIPISYQDNVIFVRCLINECEASPSLLGLEALYELGVKLVIDDKGSRISTIKGTKPCDFGFDKVMSVDLVSPVINNKKFCESCAKTSSFCSQETELDEVNVMINYNTEIFEKQDFCYYQFSEYRDNKGDINYSNNTWNFIH